MSKFGETLRRTRTKSSFQFECRILPMTHEDPASGQYKFIGAEELHVRYWEPNRVEWVDDRIRNDPEVAEKIRKNAPQNTDKWAFGTVQGLIACTDGLFIVNYYGLKDDQEQRNPGAPMMPGEHPFKKGGSGPHPFKKY